MELFSDVVRGPYAFLLILQILIVSGLLLTLIWLIIQRTREAALKEANVLGAETPAQEKTDAEKAAASAAGGEAGETLGEPLLGESLDGTVSGFGSSGEAAPLGAQPTSEAAAPVPASGGTSAAGSTNESVPHSAANSSAVSELLAEKDREMKLLSDESMTLKDKIKYLESRLMEYEIVQEEISSLSQLRVENERLKEELLQFQASRKPAEAGAPPGEAAPATPGPAGEPNPVLDNVSQDQIDNILKKLDQITSAKV